MHTCEYCGKSFDCIMDLTMHVGPGGCLQRHLAKQIPPVTGYNYRKLSDGTFIVGLSGDLNNHWHLAPDGTVLAVKEGGHHLFKRTDVTKKIRDVCPDLDISFLWEG